MKGRLSQSVEGLFRFLDLIVAILTKDTVYLPRKYSVYEECRLSNRDSLGFRRLGILNQSIPLIINACEFLTNPRTITTWIYLLLDDIVSFCFGRYIIFLKERFIENIHLPRIDFGNEGQIR